jgi:hypothetical protein
LTVTAKKTGFLRRPCIVLIVALMGLCQSCLAQQAAAREKRAALEAEMNDAMDQVRNIVNQPANAITRTADMQVSTFRPGWFHQGVIPKPDFNNVDVRKTQDTATYAKNQFVTSDLNPGLVWLGSQVEFNPATKYFYPDYSVPKRRLSEQEMLEINRLYRVIGRCERELAEMQR